MMTLLCCSPEKWWRATLLAPAETTSRAAALLSSLVGFAVLVRIVDNDAQPRSEGFEPAHDFRIGQVIGKDIGAHLGVGLALVEEVEKDPARFEAEPGIGSSFALERRRIEIELRLADRRHDLPLVREVALIGLRTGKSAREADIEKRPARRAMRIDGCPRRRLGDKRTVAVPEHRRHLIGHGAIERNAWNMRPTELLDRRAHAGAGGQLDVFRGCLCLQAHVLEYQEIENIARLG